MKRRALGLSIRNHERLDIGEVTIFVTRSKPSQVSLVVLAPEEVKISRPGTFGRQELTREQHESMVASIKSK